MTNTVFSPALQAPITLTNPTGSVTVTGASPNTASQASPIPPNGSLIAVGLAVKLALGMTVGAAQANIASASPLVVSAASQFVHPSTGGITFGLSAPTVTQANVTNSLTFPRVMLVGVGGDQSYGCNAATSYPRWTTAASGSAANVAVQTIGAYDVAILSGVFEGWDTSGARDRENLTQALLKNATYAVTKSTARPTKVFYYEIMNATISGNPYAQWQALVDANNWYLYESIGGVGTKTPAGGGQSFLNYSTAWPGAIGSAGIGASICGTNYGTTSSGSPTGAQGPARTFGNYAALKLLIRGSSTIVDPRFSFNAQMASPSASGIFLDECFVALDGAGTVPDSSLDGISIAPGSQQGGGFPGLDTVQPVMARGIHNMFDQLQTILGTYGTAGNTYYNFANFGQYANKYQFGTTTLNCGLENTLHGGLLENVLGAGASSWECFQIGNTTTGNTTYASGWPNLLANYYQGMDFCQAPKLVGVGAKLPATDGSQTASIPTGAGTTLATVTTGTTAEYQLMRYGLCTTLLDDGYFCPGVTGYDWSLLRWYDEYGDDSLTQVNVPRGYLGVALSARPTSPTWAQGTLGVWSRSFAGGIAIVNPRGNGAQTVTLPQSYQKLTGTQQPTVNSGSIISSVTLADGDGIILITSGFLPMGHWVQGPMALNLIHPRPDTETGTITATAAQNRLAYYDGVQPVQFESPYSAQGGTRPHVYQIISGPSWLNIGSTWGSAMYGILYGIPTAAISKASPATVIVRITGQDKAHIDVTSTIATSSAIADFVFTNSTGSPQTINGVTIGVGSDTTGTGSLSTPFASLTKIMGTTSTQITFPRARVYMVGNQQWPVQSGAYAGGFQMDSSRIPIVYMTLPGANVTIDASNVQLYDQSVGSFDGGYFSGSGSPAFGFAASLLTINGGPSQPPSEHTFELYNTNRLTWRNLRFTNPVSRSTDGNNCSSIMGSNSGILKKYWLYLNVGESGRTMVSGAGSVDLFTVPFSVTDIVMEFCSAVGAAPFGTYIKDSNERVTVAYSTFHNTNNSLSLQFGGQTNNGRAGNCEACYNYVHGVMFFDFQGFANNDQYWSYRNTIYNDGLDYGYALGNWGPAGTGPYSTNSDILLSKGLAVSTSGAPITNTNTEVQMTWPGNTPPTNIPILPATGVLVNISGGTQWRSLYLFTRGAEIG